MLGDVWTQERLRILLRGFGFSHFRAVKQLLNGGFTLDGRVRFKKAQNF